MALPKKYSNQYLSSEGVMMETEPNGKVVIKQIPPSGTLVVTDDDGVLDTSWQDIFDAMVAGTITVIMTIEGETSVSMDPVVYATYAQEAYGVQTATGLYISLTADGYPELYVPGAGGGGDNEPVA